MADILRLVSEADGRTLPTLSQLSENGPIKTFVFFKAMKLCLTVRPAAASVCPVYTEPRECACAIHDAK